MGGTSAGGAPLAGGTAGTAGTAVAGSAPSFAGFAGTPSIGGSNAIGLIGQGGAPSGGSGGVPAFGGNLSGGDNFTIGGFANTAGNGGISISNGDNASTDLSGSGCDAPGLIWKTANKTSYASYPDPNTNECGRSASCEHAGEFAACGRTRSQAWVQAHNIAAVFPSFGTLGLHDLCLKAGSKTMIVTVLDQCTDFECDGCCSENKGSASELIELESHTNARFGVADGPIQWADLGPTQTAGCN